MPLLARSSSSPTRRSPVRAGRTVAGRPRHPTHRRRADGARRPLDAGAAGATISRPISTSRSPPTASSWPRWRTSCAPRAQARQRQSRHARPRTLPPHCPPGPSAGSARGPGRCQARGTRTDQDQRGADARFNQDDALPLARWGATKGSSCVSSSGCARFSATWSREKLCRPPKFWPRSMPSFRSSRRRGRSSAPATVYRYLDGGGRVGMIASVTRPFCGHCDRIRLTADGQISTCLFSLQNTTSSPSCAVAAVTTTSCAC